MGTKFGMIRKYFSTPEKPVTLQELKKLSTKDKDELAELISKETGETIEMPPDSKKK